MTKESLPIYQIQDYHSSGLNKHYFYLNSFASHLKEHLFIQKPHKHDFYIVLFITTGVGKHTIDFNEYEVKPNTVFFMVPGQVHSWQLSEDADGYIIMFTATFYLKFYPDRKLYHYPFFNASLHKPVLTVSSFQETNILNYFMEMAQEHSSGGWLKQEMICHYLDMILIRFARLFRGQVPEEEYITGSLSQLQFLEDLIDKHYKKHLPVSFYAEQIHVTIKQLNDTSKRALGKTVNELVQERILLEAQRLLVHSDLTSTQIAADLGYFDNAYFFRFFKKQTGLTPEQFRNSEK